jgi:hypothetical protein
MLGNVWEWCCDQYDPQVYGAYRIFRGGGWADHERGCLATNRRRSHPTFRIDDLGFRLCANARAPGTAVRKDSNESNVPNASTHPADSHDAARNPNPDSFVPINPSACSPHEPKARLRASCDAP